MSDDIDILNDSDGISENISKKVKGLKKVNKHLSDAEKEEKLSENLVNRAMERRKRTKFTDKVNALASLGMSQQEIQRAMVKFNKAPAHVAYSYLAQRGAPQHVLNAIVRNASPAARAHIAQQMPVGAATNIAGMGQTSPFVNPRVAAQQQAMAQGAFSGQMPGSGVSGQLVSALNAPIAGLRQLSVAVGVAAAGVVAYTNAMAAGREARSDVSGERDNADRIKQNLVKAGIATAQEAERFHRQGGAGALSVMQRLTTENATAPAPGYNGMRFRAAFNAGAGSGDYTSVMANLDNLPALGRLSKMNAAGGKGVIETNKINYDALYRSQGATAADKAAKSAERMRVSTNSDLDNMLENLPGVREIKNQVGANQIINRENRDGRGFSSTDRLGNTVISPRSGGVREQTYESQQPRGPTVINVDKINVQPKTNPFLGAE